MRTKELLIEEINHAPEGLLQQLLRYLRVDLQEQNKIVNRAQPSTNGPYADYWNQYLGAFVNQEWDRPAQDSLEQRESW